MPLASGFLASTEDDWRRAAARSGGGAGPGTISDDGIPVGPIYGRRTGTLPIIGRQPGKPWRIVERIDAADIAAAAEACGKAIGGGATGAEIVFAESAHPLPGRVPASSATDLARAVASVLPEGFHLRVDAGPHSAVAAEAFLDLAGNGGLELVAAFDPIAIAAAGGSGEADAAGTPLVRMFAAQGIVGTALLADGRIWHAGGASEAQELGAALATIASHLRTLDATGIGLDGAAARIGVALAADVDQFLTVAKFRAMRLLLAAMMEASGIAGTAIPIHAETAWRMMSRRASRMNALRATGAIFSAAAGGADSITVLPFDILAGDSDDGARRLARNTQTILAGEAHLPRFGDPGAGSGAVETLTDALAEAAWRQFQEIEAGGGILAALRSGTLQRQIAAVRDARLARVRSGEIEMIGVNAFADGDPLPERTRPDQPAIVSTAPIEALVFTRLAEAVEGEP